MSVVIEQPLAVRAKREKSAYESLKRRHKRFVDHFVSGAKASDAVRSAGCKSQHARSVASKLLRRSEIQAAIEERTRLFLMDTEARSHKTIERVVAIAYADPRKVVNSETGKAVPLEDLDPATAAAIASVEVENISIDGETGVRYKYKFWDKPKMLIQLGQWQKLWDGPGAKVNVDARSVTVNNGDSAVAAAAIQSVLRLGAQLAEGRPAIGAEAPGSDRSVLPAEVHPEPAGRGASMAVGADSGRPEGA